MYIFEAKSILENNSKVSKKQKLKAMHIGANALDRLMPKKVIRKPNINWDYEEITCPTCGMGGLKESYPCWNCYQNLDWE